MRLDFIHLSRYNVHISCLFYETARLNLIFYNDRNSLQHNYFCALYNVVSNICNSYILFPQLTLVLIFSILYY